MCAVRVSRPQAGVRIASHGQDLPSARRGGVHSGPVVASADGDTDDDAPVTVSVGFMVVPGFYVNRIVVHSKVYTVKREYQ